MIQTLFVEKNIQNRPVVEKIKSHFKNADVKLVDSYQDIFGRVRKPYLQKRDNLNLFLAEKKGEIVKAAPDAYGLSGDEHYYFVHAYNCIYECQYCYLQGYFNSPDLVFFVNHEEICQEIEKVARQKPNQTIWFHAGEFSDSLALSHITGELPLLFKTFQNNPNAKLELRTKSANLQELKKLQPLDNIIVSFSLSPQQTSREIDLKTPSLNIRLKALQELEKLGYKLALHFDPMIYSADFESRYNEMIQQIFQHIKPQSIDYISIGVVRFTKDVYREVERNYPDSNLLKQDFIKSFDNKIRYNRPTRMYMMETVKKMLLKKDIQDSKIYLCMEQPDSTEQQSAYSPV